MNAFKMETGLRSIGSKMKGSNSDVPGFDSPAEFNLSFFETSTPPHSVPKKESEFINDRDTEGLFESIIFSPDSIKKEDFSSERSEGLFESMSSDFGGTNTYEESKYAPYPGATTPNSSHQTPPSPLPALSPLGDPLTPRGGRFVPVLKSGRQGVPGQDSHHHQKW